MLFFVLVLVLLCLLQVCFFAYTFCSGLTKDKEFSPIRTALVTAREAPAHERVIKTLNSWGVRIDEAFFLGGAEKHKILEAFGANIFFDDQDLHLEKSSKIVPSAKVINNKI